MSAVPVTFVAVLLSSAIPIAAEPDSADAEAGKLVQQALQQEIDGTSLGREDLLAKALQSDPEYAPARWHSGFVRRASEWVRFRDVPKIEDSREDVDEYRRLRDSSTDSFQEQVELANWCRRHELFDRERAHLTAALSRPGKSNEAGLRSRLGFVLVDGRWQRREELQEAQQAARQRQRDYEYWRPKIARIARGLGRPQSYQQSVEQLKAIDDPAALPALEAVLSDADTPSTAFVLLDVYANMKSHRAAVGLARQAVLSPWPGIREAASEKLKSRPPEAYVPIMIASLHTPVTSQVGLYVGGDGVRLTQVFFRENKDFKELGVRKAGTAFQRQTYLLPPGSRRSPATRNMARNSIDRIVDLAVIDAEVKAYGAERQVDAENTRTQLQNERICGALATATGVDLPPDPQAWWQWWMYFNELYDNHKKPWRFYYRTEPTDIEILPAYVAPPAKSCLAAGTLVWTDRGAIPVETVQVGDLALSKHPETGELAYKPVLRTTVRPATRLLAVTAGEGAFHVTGGHTFWMSGRGWEKIRDVRPGMRFHTAAGPVELNSEIVDGPEEPTYNLVVADFHTYFVGPSMLLSHDTTFARPLDVLVPGLEAK